MYILRQSFFESDIYLGIPTLANSGGPPVTRKQNIILFYCAQ